jgi:hypothetical protein
VSVGVCVRAYMEEVSDVCASITADGGDGRLCSVFFVFLAFLAPRAVALILRTWAWVLCSAFVCASLEVRGVYNHFESAPFRQHNVLLLGAWLLSSVLQPAG